MFAACYKNIKNVEMLLSHGASVTARDEQGRTVMFKTMDQDIADMLLSHGANINAKDKQGWTPYNGFRWQTNSLISNM